MRFGRPGWSGGRRGSARVNAGRDGNKPMVEEGASTENYRFKNVKSSTRLTPRNYSPRKMTSMYMTPCVLCRSIQYWNGRGLLCRPVVPRPYLILIVGLHLQTGVKLYHPGSRVLCRGRAGSCRWACSPTGVSPLRSELCGAFEARDLTRAWCYRRERDTHAKVRKAWPQVLSAAEQNLRSHFRTRARRFTKHSESTKHVRELVPRKLRTAAVGRGG